MVSTSKSISFLIPVFNEEAILKTNTLKLLNYLKNNLPPNFKFKIVIGDNGSTDSTSDIASDLSKKYRNIDSFSLHKKGRGYAIRHIIQNTDSKFLIYMDADMATSLNSIKEIIHALTKSGVDIAIGSRYLKKSKSKRTFSRKFLSKTYNFFIKFLFNLPISDTQCGFKGFNVAKVRPFIKRVANNKFFFDTELLVLSHRKLSIREVPISWRESSNTKVRFLETITSYILESFKLKWRLLKKK